MENSMIKDALKNFTDDFNSTYEEESDKLYFINDDLKNAMYNSVINDLVEENDILRKICLKMHLDSNIGKFFLVKFGSYSKNENHKICYYIDNECKTFIEIPINNLGYFESARLSIFILNYLNSLDINCEEDIINFYMDNDECYDLIL